MSIGRQLKKNIDNVQIIEHIEPPEDRFSYSSTRDSLERFFHTIREQIIYDVCIGKTRLSYTDIDSDRDVRFTSLRKMSKSKLPSCAKEAHAHYDVWEDMECWLDAQELELAVEEHKENGYFFNTIVVTPNKHI